MFKNNKNLIIISLIAIVNALGYGIIIPLLYSYSHKFGLTDFQNGLLFSTFSVCQFIATPIIGRLSDKYGRKPLLVISIAGTALSFFMMAFAPSALFLFLARALDGLTAGNIPVASAVISDTTDEKNRARGFGIIGASFGFGFIFGPAISALTVGFGESIPFIIAALVSTVAVAATLVYLPETNKHMGEVKKGKLFDFAKLFQALFDKNVGVTLFITLVYSLAFGMFIFAFQPFAVKVLNLTPAQISSIFTLFGVLGLITQIFFVQKLVNLLGLKKALEIAMLILGFSFATLFFSKSFLIFIFGSVFLAISNSFVQPLVQATLSKETDLKSQGSILGINASYMSIGQILGPIIGGILASFIIPLPFLAGGIFSFLAFILSLNILKREVKKRSEF